MRQSAVTCLRGVALLVSGLAFACDEHFPELQPAPAAVESPEPPSIVPPAQRRNVSSSRIVFDPQRGGVWTANGDVGSVSYVNVDTREATSETPVGRDITSVALSPDASVVAAVDRAGGSVALLAADTAEAIATIAVGSHPRACVWDAANPRWLYVSVEDDGAVVVVDRFLAQVAGSIPVGRLPSGLAVSSSRRELYVTHRIDGQLTVIDLHDRAVVADVPLADEPYSALQTPNGKPFGFEAPAITSEGRFAWMPHELLAPTHPFVFNETLFPTISVVDLFVRAEAQTNPNFSNIAGRKNLFAGINVIGPDGQPEVFSQLCAVAIHPMGFVAWALACGSEDLLTFDVGQGIAIDALRDLPVDHPVGLALDDTGQRVFVLGDQSHAVVTFDTSNGSLVAHTRLYGDPIGTLRTPDPVDPTLRAGLTLFFRANSSKGLLATTAKNWMSCGGCHLDGFTTTNARFFEALSPPDPAEDALIGHVGLVDHFSTSVESGPDSSPFNPHDFFVALTDQGGLAPDAPGRDREAGRHDGPAARGGRRPRFARPALVGASAGRAERGVGRCVLREMPPGRVPGVERERARARDERRDGHALPRPGGAFRPAMRRVPRPDGRARAAGPDPRRHLPRVPRRRTRDRGRRQRRPRQVAHADWGGRSQGVRPRVARYAAPARVLRRLPPAVRARQRLRRDIDVRGVPRELVSGGGHALHRLPHAEGPRRRGQPPVPRG